MPSPGATQMKANEALRFSAVVLFVERAGEATEKFQFVDRDTRPVVEICALLDGNPLAIELAAAHVTTFAPTEIAKQLRNSISLLTHGRRTAPPRHLSFRASLDWSFELLSEEEQTTLLRLAEIEARFSLEKALNIAACRILPAGKVLDALHGLAAKSLVCPESRNGLLTYRLADTTRIYALQRFQNVTAESERFSIASESHGDEFTRIAANIADLALPRFSHFAVI
jgi:predicted ATPase